MEIVKRKALSKTFRVLVPKFSFKGPVIKGQEIEIEDEGLAIHWCRRGFIEPCDLPDIGSYIATTDFELPSRKEKFSAKHLDIVELKKADALRLMFGRRVIPLNDDQWRPFGRRLKTGADHKKLSDIFSDEKRKPFASSYKS